jgi:hypothetical protein
LASTSSAQSQPTESRVEPRQEENMSVIVSSICIKFAVKFLRSRFNFLLYISFVYHLV